MKSNYIGERDIVAFSSITNKMRSFFLEKGFTEVHTQDRLSILAACEDPDTVAGYRYKSDQWPLPQTGQMWLEYELLTKSHLNGIFCVSTSYRNEPNPVEGRHKLIFPMFEFEAQGGIDALRKLEIELLEYLGFGKSSNFSFLSYRNAQEHYKTEEISHAEEEKMSRDFSPITFLEMFPKETSPFWNMKKADAQTSAKIDVIMYGQETIGSAERSCNIEEMRNEFYTISEGGYAKKLFDLFGKERVEKELEEYLALDFFPRCGGGIGISRMISAFKAHEKIRNLVRA